MAWPSGKRLKQTKLSSQDIGGIRVALTCGMTQREIAQIYGVTQSHISRIKNFRRRLKKGLTSAGNLVD